MTCKQVEEQDILEGYLHNRLAREVRDEFEEHYFVCETCFTQLQTMRAAVPVLAAMPPPPTPIKQDRWWMYFGAIAAAAAILVAIFGVRPRGVDVKAPPSGATVASAPTAERKILPLGEIEPPPFPTAVFRGDSTTAHPAALLTGASLYRARSWSAAAAAFKEVERRDPGAPIAVHFYAISLLLDNKVTDAIAAFDRVIGVGEASPYLEEARCYRAQALVLAGRLEDARAELERTIALRGDYEDKARALLARL